MGATADIEDLSRAEVDMTNLEKKYPEAYETFKLFFTNHKGIGYKNIMKMMLYGKTPEELKE